MPVPQAFVLGTDWCRLHQRDGDAARPLLHGALGEWTRRLEQACGLAFGGERKPLLVSVRSGAPVSMPGMMDTVLNIGLCDRTVRGLLRLTGNPRLVWDSYRRLVQQYAQIVHGADPAPFDGLAAAAVAQAGVASARELDFESLAQARRRQRGALRRGDRGRVPAGSARAARGGHRGGVRVLAFGARPGVPPAAPHRRLARHRRHGAAHGLRKRRRDVGLGRGVHARPRHRREPALPRLPVQRAGRGRRVGPPPGHGHGPAPRGAAGGGAAARGIAPRAGGDLPRRAGIRVHRAGRAPLPAADADREAHAVGGAAHGRRPGAGRPRHAGAGARAPGRHRPRGDRAPPRRRRGRGGARHRAAGEHRPRGGAPSRSTPRRASGWPPRGGRPSS